VNTTLVRQLRRPSPSFSAHSRRSSSAGDGRLPAKPMPWAERSHSAALLGIMVYALGHISGGHFNPAVRSGSPLGRRFSWTKVPKNVIASAAGATVAALLLRLTLSSGAPLGVTHPSGSDGQSFVWESHPGPSPGLRGHGRGN